MLERVKKRSEDLGVKKWRHTAQREGKKQRGELCGRKAVLQEVEGQRACVNFS